MMPIPGITAAPLLINPGLSGPSISKIFNVSLWTGTGSARTITTGIDSGEGSLVWTKSRSVANSHILVDSVRGDGNYLSSNSTAASTADAQSISGFTSTGYGLGTLGSVNGSGTTQVGWQFRRAEKFFDIVQYSGNNATGRKITHSLGVRPGFLVVKRINGSSDWPTQHISTGYNNFGFLNGDYAFDVGSMWGANADANEFTVGASGDVNATGGQYIAYLFAHDPSPEGFIQCGSYVGNGSATGPVVNLGWRPQYLMIKNATAAGDWQIIDASRGFTAANDAILLANTSGAETSANLVNPSSTGFQISATASNVNTSGQTYVYMAIREA